MFLFVKLTGQKPLLCIVMGAPKFIRMVISQYGSRDCSNFKAISMPRINMISPLTSSQPKNVLLCHGLFHDFNPLLPPALDVLPEICALRRLSYTRFRS